MMMINDQVIEVDTSVWEPSVSPPLSDNYRRVFDYVSCTCVGIYVL